MNYHSTGLSVLIALSGKASKRPAQLSGWHMNEPHFYSDQTDIQPIWRVAHPGDYRLPIPPWPSAMKEV
jgi:hypothetical protein